MGIKIPITSRSNNFKQLVLSGELAIIESVLLMLNTPMDRSQEDPTYGFNLNDFLFRVKNSDELPELKREFIDKIRKVTLREDVSASFEFNDRTFNINLSIPLDNDKILNVPITVNDKLAQVVEKITLE